MARRTILAMAMAIACGVSATAAAPLWIERQFIPDPDAVVDPVFAQWTPDSEILVDHAAWDDFLSTYVAADKAGDHRVDYAGVTDEDRASLEAYIDRLEAIDPRTLNRDEQLAFWINLYNAVTVRLILENYPVESIRKIDGPWAEERTRVIDVDLSLGDIEHKIVRVVYQDPRIHYALNCAAISCPNLAVVAYDGARLDDQLTAAARAFVNSPKGVSFDDDGDLDVSKIFGWYKSDYGGSEQSAIDHIRLYADDDLAARLDGVKGIDDYDYDWALNDQATIPPSN